MNFSQIKNYKIWKISQKFAVCALFLIALLCSANAFATTVVGNTETCPSGQHLVPDGANTFKCEALEKDEYMCGFPDDPKAFVLEMKQFCWFCVPLNSMVKSYQKLSVGIYSRLSGSFLALIAACFVIWIAIVVTRQIMSIKARSMPEFYTYLLKISLRVIFGAALISIGSDLWSYTIGPMAGIVFEYGSAAMPDMPRYSDDFGSSQSISLISSKIIGSGNTLGGICAAINAHIMGMIADCWIMMTAAMNDSSYCIPVDDNSNFLLFVFSLFLMIAMITYLFIVPLKFADIIFRLGLFMALLPLFIFCWIFPLTDSYFKKGANLLLNVMLSLLLLALTVTLCTELIRDGVNLPKYTGNTFEEIKEEFGRSLVLDLSSAITITAYLIFTFKILPTSLKLANYYSDANYGASGFEGAIRKSGKAAGVAVAKGVAVIALTIATLGVAGLKIAMAKTATAAAKAGAYAVGKATSAVAKAGAKVVASTASAAGKSAISTSEQNKAGE